MSSILAVCKLGATTIATTSTFAAVQYIDARVLPASICYLAAVAAASTICKFE